ncbi:hypothetical protein B0H17DRAFT_1207336 [Mycena rosella]|uniref:Uncharacterized protein n=1 Tax=Mycena rosella TaxID=1033263 RepID=A0AAD7GAM5_MYCRO|nr:hypothetical protein B0H17DRAFT_1207336 [Mycena rosella]
MHTSCRAFVLSCSTSSGWRVRRRRAAVIVQGGYKREQAATGADAVKWHGRAIGKGDARRRRGDVGCAAGRGLSLSLLQTLPGAAFQLADVFLPFPFTHSSCTPNCASRRARRRCSPPRCFERLALWHGGGGGTRGLARPQQWLAADKVDAELMSAQQTGWHTAFQLPVLEPFLRTFLSFPSPHPQLRPQLRGGYEELLHATRNDGIQARLRYLNWSGSPLALMWSREMASASLPPPAAMPLVVDKDDRAVRHRTGREDYQDAPLHTLRIYPTF